MNVHERLQQGRNRFKEDISQTTWMHLPFSYFIS